MKCRLLIAVGLLAIACSSVLSAEPRGSPLNLHPHDKWHFIGTFKNDDGGEGDVYLDYSEIESLAVYHLPASQHEFRLWVVYKPPLRRAYGLVAEIDEWGLLDCSTRNIEKNTTLIAYAPGDDDPIRFGNTHDEVAQLIAAKTGTVASAVVRLVCS